jgi:hypothetical protein
MRTVLAASDATGSRETASPGHNAARSNGASFFKRFAKP